MTETLRNLEAAAQAAFSGPKHRTAVFVFEGRQYVAKRLASKPRRLCQILFVRWLVKRLTGQPLPVKSLALTEAAQSVDFEVQRLKSLASSGVRVPRVVLSGRELFVMEHCGTVVATLLENWEPSTWRNVLPKLAEELAAFHQAGHWHGGAQIRNITLCDGISYRIDFEENFGNFLPLAVSQLNDLLLFLNSVSLAGPIDEQESRALLPDLLERYFAINPDQEIRALIGKALPLLRTLTRMASPFQSRSKKGIRRSRILVDALAAELARDLKAD